jgi:hypothetical protein
VLFGNKHLKEFGQGLPHYTTIYSCISAAFKYAMNLQESSHTNDGLIIEYITLRDGRTFRIADLMQLRGKPVNYNLRTRKETQIKQRGPNKELATIEAPNFNAPNCKYSFEERKWQSTASGEEIQARYGLDTIKRAMSTKYKAIYIMNYLRAHALLDENDLLKP